MQETQRMLALLWQRTLIYKVRTLNVDIIVSICQKRFTDWLRGDFDDGLMPATGLGLPSSASDSSR